MKFEKQTAAKKLRIEGKSINLIAQTLEVSKSSVSLWVRDIILTTEQKENLTAAKSYNFKYELNDKKKKEALEKRKSSQEKGKEKAREKDLLHCMGSMLFWAEGTKKKNSITFTNSDPNMMKLFVKFLRERLDVQNDKICMHINCFLNRKEDIIISQQYWVECLNISGCKIYKPTIKLTNKQIENHGICRITVLDTQLAQEVYGAIQEYGNFDNGLCLEDKPNNKCNVRVP